MGKLQEKLTNNEWVWTAEITPPKGAGIKKLLRHAAILGPVVDAINITDCQRALVRMSSLCASKVLNDNGYEAVFQLTCRDRNTIGLQSDLMGAGALGIENLLCLTGDPVKVGDSPESKSVFEIESTKLLQLVGKLQENRDGGGHKMNRRTRFFVGAVVNPTCRSSAQLDRMEKKMAAGARFFQTQANYDIPDYVAFLQKARALPTKILGGILILHSYDVAQYIHEKIPGIQVPAEVLQRFKGASDPIQEGLQFAQETMQAIRPYVDGFHLMSIRAEELIPQLREAYDKQST